MRTRTTKVAPQMGTYEEQLASDVSKDVYKRQDLGDRSSWYCVLNESGEVVLEQRLGTTPKAMKEVFGAMPHCRIALATGMHSPWVSRVLSELGHEVIVAHARNVRLIGESRKKDDRLDAQTLARLARICLLYTSGVQIRSEVTNNMLASRQKQSGFVDFFALSDGNNDQAVYQALDFPRRY